MKAVIPAAGLGTRLLPATKSMPKEMLPVVDKPVIQYVVEEAVAAGCDDILIVTGRGKRAIEDHFDRSFELEHYLNKAGHVTNLRKVRAISETATVHYTRQSEPLGLGHAVLCAAKFVGNEPFAVLLGDDIVVDAASATRELVRLYETTGKSALSVMPVSREDVSRYGIVRPGPERQGADWFPVLDIVEKPRPEVAPSNLAAMGRYVLGPEVFDILRKTGPDHRGEIQLTDALRPLCSGNGLVAHRFRGTRLDVGTVQGFLQANVTLALQRPEFAEDFHAFIASIVAKPPN